MDQNITLESIILNNFFTNVKYNEITNTNVEKYDIFSDVKNINGILLYNNTPEDNLNFIKDFISIVDNFDDDILLFYNCKYKNIYKKSLLENPDTVFSNVIYKNDDIRNITLKKKTLCILETPPFDFIYNKIKNVLYIATTDTLPIYTNVIIVHKIERNKKYQKLFFKDIACHVNINYESYKSLLENSFGFNYIIIKDGFIYFL